jgi:hypothetical protein
MQVQDDVDDRLGLLADSPDTKRNIEEVIELTCRAPSSEIPGYLQRMEVPLGRTGQAPLDVILATNMMSVGVDIDRLGLMVVMGQPQATAEYIQATSRVGRGVPGLVVVLFNAARSRDRSHYEAFLAYHSALYRAVEATSVTPFSARARDRGLHAVLIGLVRLLYSDFRPNGGAGRIRTNPNEVRAIADLIVQRVREISGSAEAQHTAEDLDQLITDWTRQVPEEGTLLYNNKRDQALSLLIEADDRPRAGRGLPTMRSLRDVDKEAGLYVVELDDEPRSQRILRWQLLLAARVVFVVISL